MSRSPGPAGATATLDATPEVAAAQVRSTLEAVFEAVAETRADTTARLTGVAAQGRRPATVDLAALRPGLHLRLTRQELVSGVGFGRRAGTAERRTGVAGVVADRLRRRRAAAAARPRPRALRVLRLHALELVRPPPRHRGSGRSPAPMWTTSVPTSTA